MNLNAIAIPDEVRELLDAPNYVHLSTLRADGSPRNHVVWAWVEDDLVIVGARKDSAKGKDMQRDPRVALSVVDMEDPYRMAALRGQVVQIRPEDDYELMDRLAIKYTGVPFPCHEPGLVYFVIAIEHAYQRTLDGFTHNPVASADVQA